MCKRREDRAFERTLIEIDTLTPIQKTIISERYIPFIDVLAARCFFFAIFFHTMRLIITVGSLIVPALLSIQYNGSNEQFTLTVYWTAWTVSLLVTTSNGVLTLFKIDKKYFFLHTVLEQLKSEGWQYLELSGKYSGFYTPNRQPTHDNQFIFFCHAIEKLKMKQVEEEYFKVESTTHPTGTAQQENQAPAKQFTSDGLIPPTPLNPNFQQVLAAIENSTHQIDGAKASSVPMRPPLQRASSGRLSILPETQSELSTPVAGNRVGTEVPTVKVE
jgi:hypothetical protein